MNDRTPPPDRPVRHGVARVLSKRGLASRTVAAEWVRAGRVRVNGRTVTDPEYPVRATVDTVEVEGQASDDPGFVAVMLNKPRGLVTTARDERGRETVYRCLEGSGLPWLGPVGRLDKASEGLLLLCNDPVWAAAITGPDAAVEKTYHVQVQPVPSEDLLLQARTGTVVDGEHLNCHGARLLRTGGRRAWLEIVLREGRNRQIRRLLEALGLDVVRLVRVAIGPLQLGALQKGAWRKLEPAEIAALVPGGPPRR
jgi:23S rRNA pseudouridine2605 synthase